MGLAAVATIPATSPFNYFDRSIISIDTLKNNLEYRKLLRLGVGTTIIDERTTSPRGSRTPGSRCARAWRSGSRAAPTRSFCSLPRRTTARRDRSPR